ncbi:MAG: hypothetical protein VCG02_09595, partial [Verrucomicrobiota bacterium]
MKGSLARFYLAAALLPGGLSAQNQFFDGEALDTAWSSAANWSLDTLPVARAVIAGGLTATTTSGDAFTVTDLQVGSGVEGPAGNGALTMNGGTINASELTVGRNGHEGTVTLSNGAILNLSGHLRIARHDGSVGTVEIGGAASEVNVAGQIIVGNNESGSGRVHAFLNQNGGTINMAVNQDFQVANNQFSDGTFNQTGGTLNTLRWMNLGRADGTSTAALNTTGNVHAGATIQLRNGTWNQSGGLVSNGVISVSADINLGVDPGGDGTFIQAAGTLYASRNLNLGRAAAQGTGNMDVSGTVDAGENITVNNGTFRHRAGAHVRTGVRVNGGDLNVGTAAGSSGTYLYEGGSLAVGDVLGIGRDQGDGTGYMSINGNIDIDSNYLLRNGTIQHNSGDIVAGLQNNNADFNMGSAGSGSGNYTLVSGSITVDRNMNLQNGTFTQQAGAVVLGADHGGDLSIGTANGVEGTYDQQGGTLTIGNNLNIGGWSFNTGVGHFNSGSAQSIGRGINLNKGSYRQTNGDLIVGSVLSDGDLNIADGTSEDGTLELLNGNLVVADQVIIGQNEAGGFGRATVNGNVTTESHLSVRNGFLDVSNGAIDIGTALNTASVNIGSSAGGVGTMNLDSTGFQVSQHLNINKGNYIQSNGSTVVGARHTDGDLTIADGMNEDASLEIQGGNLTVADEVSIGRNLGDGVGHGVVGGNVASESNFWLRHGTFTANTGTVDIGTDNVNADLQIGHQIGGVGTFMFNGTSFVLSRTMHINKGAFVQQSGTVSIGSRSATPGSLNIGTGAAEDASYTLNGGSLTVAGELLLGQTGFGTDGVGTMESHGDVSLGKSAQVNRGTWN